MKKICICGHFGFGLNLLNGQTIKTKIITDELRREYGSEALYLIDTHGRKNILLMFLRLIYALFTCRNIVILPAQNSVRIVPLWLRFWNLFFTRDIHYIVIGGWLADMTDRHRSTRWALKALHIYPETSTMHAALRERGLSKVTVLPNCKPLHILKPEELSTAAPAKPLRLVTFSRVMKQKGIGDAAQVIDEINKELGYDAFTLDIFGQVESDETQWFAELQKTFPPTVCYKGCVDFDKSVDTLSQYFALLFPTRFYTEGIPGTIIDAYAAGLPVISSRWESFADVVDDNETGIGYEFDNVSDLKKVLLQIADAPSSVIKLKHNCIRKAESYLPQNVIPRIKLT